MRGEIHERHNVDEEGRPAGGQSTGKGFVIHWQHGPMVGADGARLEQNGAFVEDVLAAVAGRIEHYQSSPFQCDDNAEALDHIYQAQLALERRTKEREARGVEGTHEV